MNLLSLLIILPQKLYVSSFMTFDKCLQFSMILHDYSEYSFIYHSKTKLMLILAIKAINNCLSKGNSYSKQRFINRHGKTVS